MPLISKSEKSKVLNNKSAQLVTNLIKGKLPRKVTYNTSFPQKGYIANRNARKGPLMQKHVNYGNIDPFGR